MKIDEPTAIKAWYELAREYQGACTSGPIARAIREAAIRARFIKVTKLVAILVERHGLDAGPLIEFWRNPEACNRFHAALRLVDRLSLRHADKSLRRGSKASPPAPAKERNAAVQAYLAKHYYRRISDETSESGRLDLARGVTLRAIAAELGCAPNTVRTTGAWRQFAAIRKQPKKLRRTSLPNFNDIAAHETDNSDDHLELLADDARDSERNAAEIKRLTAAQKRDDRQQQIRLND
jgi:hypothetical protein